MNALSSSITAISHAKNGTQQRDKRFYGLNERETLEKRLDIKYTKHLLAIGLVIELI